MKTSRFRHVSIKMILTSKLFILTCLPLFIKAQWSQGPNPTTNDNVGIGTSPTSKLSIGAAWGINNCTYSGIPALKIDWSGPSTFSNCQNGINGIIPDVLQVINHDYTTSTFMVLRSNGNFGLNTSTPQKRIHVIGEGQFESNQKVDLITIQNTGNGVLNASSALLVQYTKAQSLNPYLIRALGQNTNSTGDRFVVRNDGQVGIGVSNPDYHLNVAGGIIVDNDGHFSGDITNVSEDYVLKFGGFTSGEAIGSVRTGNQANGIDFYTAYEQRMKIRNDGAVVIGNVTAPPGYKLYVESGILTEQVKVAIKTTNDWSDFVFSPNYHLLALSEVQEYISLHHHLPDVPSAKEVVNQGVNLAEMDATLLLKIEELTLYILEQDKKIRELQSILGMK